MKKGQIIGLVVGVFVLLVLVSFGMFASGVAKEASKMDESLKQDLSQHLSFADVQKQLTDESFTTTGTGAELDAEGRTHTFIFYSTHLTLKINFNPDGKMTGYHLDRV
jgi:hypothetical protein